MRTSATLFLRRSDAASLNGGARLGLSDEGLRQIRGRLQRLSLVMFLVIATSFALSPVLLRLSKTAMGEYRDVLAGHFITLVVSGAGYVMLRSKRVSDVLSVWLGFVLEIFLVLSAALGNYLAYYSDYGHLPMIPWSLAVMLVFPLVVPRPASLTLALATIAGACIPGAALWLDWKGAIVLRSVELQMLSVNAVFAVGIAYFSARVAYGLSVHADRAARLGSYVLEDRIGSGGMGEVWRASHRMLSRPAAVKFIGGAGTRGSAKPDDEALRRFNQEAEATARLRSTHTVDIYDYGRTDDGRLYYVMELLDGIDLHRMVEHYGPLPSRRVVHLLIQACHSLHEAHTAGLVHRDIKPANLFLCRYGADYDHLKVLDFGLVKETELHADVQDHNATAKSQIIGTPAAMPPEIALGQRPVDGRADLYSLGCVAYWLLTKTMPFEADTVIQNLVKHIYERPEPPSRRAPEPVPPDLEELVLACLNKDPQDRPQSAKTLAEALRALPLDRWTEAEAEQWWREHGPSIPVQQPSTAETLPQ
jgi:hypothetical protein